VDGAAENQFDGTVEAKDLGAAEAIGRDGGMNLALEKSFVGIDIADAGQEALIEQGGLDGAASLRQPHRELSGADLQRFRTQICVMYLTIAEPPDAAEAAGIDEA